MSPSAETEGLQIQPEATELASLLPPLSWTLGTDAGGQGVGLSPISLPTLLLKHALPAQALPCRGAWDSGAQGPGPLSVRAKREGGPLLWAEDPQMVLFYKADFLTS